MSRLPVVTFAEVDRALRRLGFAVSRQRGSHVSYRHADGRATTVPNHGSRVGVEFRVPRAEWRVPREVLRNIFL